MSLNLVFAWVVYLVVVLFFGCFCQVLLSFFDNSSVLRGAVSLHAPIKDLLGDLEANVRWFFAIAGLVMSMV